MNLSQRCKLALRLLGAALALGLFGGSALLGSGLGIAGARGTGTVAFVYVYPGAPVDITAPRIAGPTTVGSTLVAEPGLWTNKPLGYRWQWLSCRRLTGVCTDITGPGSDTQTYTVTSGDVGRRLRVQVTAFNQKGSGAPVLSPLSPVVRR